MSDLPYFSRVAPHDTATPASAIEFLIRAHIAQLGPPMFAEVVAVTPGKDLAIGTVDVRPMIHQQDAAGRPYPQGTSYKVPFFRLQAGPFAMILDPKPGDIGFIVVSGRDQSDVVETGKAAPPGSFRQYDLSDCVFIGGFLNPKPTQYIQMTNEGITIVATGPIEIKAEKVHVTGDLKVDAKLEVGGDASISGDAKAGNISLRDHVHGGVQSGGSTASKPN